ncbi:hypothetical protein [Planctomycetes bacterium SV_7m_r]|uniref:hypothetical protein n=1 Tax=Stieleria bergensis TaxID=2528025 RepID=UPI00119D0553
MRGERQERTGDKSKRVQRAAKPSLGVVRLERFDAIGSRHNGTREPPVPALAVQRWQCSAGSAALAVQRWQCSAGSAALAVQRWQCSAGSAALVVQRW